MRKKMMVLAMAAAMAAFFSVNASAEELTVGFSYAKPPYVFATAPFDDKDYDLDSENLGIELDIMKYALEGSGYTFKPVYSPFKRIISDLGSGKLDAAETSGPKNPKLFYSSPIIGCENYAISKKSDNLTINKIEDLKQYSAVAWQGALTDLGETFTKTMKDNPRYIENPNQQKQFEMFMKGRIQVVVIDKYIFQWWDRELSSKYKREEYVYHPVFPGVNEYRIGFLKKEARDAFEAGLSNIKKDGTYDKIFVKYLGKK